MKRIFGQSLCLGATLCALSVADGVEPAQATGPFHVQMRLEPGQWELREVESSHPRTRTLCIADPATFIQLEHSKAACSQVVVANNPHLLVVNYVCRSSGYGHTSVRSETPRLARIETQGIVERQPFAYRAQARRIGACVRQETAAR